MIKKKPVVIKNNKFIYIYISYITNVYDTSLEDEESKYCV